MNLIIIYFCLSSCMLVGGFVLFPAKYVKSLNQKRNVVLPCYTSILFSSINPENEENNIYRDGDEGFESFEDSDAEGNVDYIVITEEELLEEWKKRGFKAKDFTIEKMLQILEEEDMARQETVHFASEQITGRELEENFDRLATRRQSFPFAEESERKDDWAPFSKGVLEDYQFSGDEMTGEEDYPEDLNSLEQDLSNVFMADGDPFSLDSVELDADDDYAYQREIRSVGIDLGTTNSAVAIVEDGRPVIIPNERGSRTTPSIVGYSKDGKTILVGEEAEKQLLSNKEATFMHTKRLIGLTLEEVKHRKEPLGALGVDKSSLGKVELKCPVLGRNIKPQEVSAQIIGYLLKSAEAYLGGNTKIKRAVVTVPAYFVDTQMEATREAAILAGLEKVKLMREPEAAALAYGLEKRDDELILVFDLGGGTFDVSVLEVGGGLIEVIATSGDSHLGGNDFDKCIADWMADEFVKTGGTDPRNDPFKMRRLLELAEKCRIRLSQAKETPVMLPFLDKEKGLDVTLTRAQMEHICNGPLSRILRPLREVAIIAGVSLDGDANTVNTRDSAFDTSADFQEESTQFKSLKKQQQDGRRSFRDTKKETKRKREQLSKVIKGIGQDEKVQFLPPGRPLSEVVMVGGATRMPCIIKLVENLTGLKPRITVNPDEAVALGAAVQAGIIDGEIQGLEVVSAWQAAWLRYMAANKEDFQDEMETN